MGGFLPSGLNPGKRYSSLRVLIVDDQPEIRSMVREILSDLNISPIFEAGNGREALRFIDAGIVNFIICDWNMPNMTGIELLRQIRLIYPDFPFLMMTGLADRDSAIRAKESGVTDLIRKPFSPGQLEEKLRILTQSEAVL